MKDPTTLSFSKKSNSGEDQSTYYVRDFSMAARIPISLQDGKQLHNFRMPDFFYGIAVEVGEA